MSDLEMTKLCAEVMGFYWAAKPDEYFYIGMNKYDPIHDEAQAMMLLKWLLARPGSVHFSNLWMTFYPNHDRKDQVETPLNKGLNRAIVECVAKMQSAKP